MMSGLEENILHIVGRDLKWKVYQVDSPGLWFSRVELWVHIYVLKKVRINIVLKQLWNLITFPFPYHGIC